ncbi:hypothetical protein KUCAC02_017100 [Chaenocephalus aceratus]|uniref:Uncharacterized protein n=1 Tax=Chaenocephalus aceratus TaxID=36190 RepID=A0ACB9W0S2_CHAAC|nr:hypothetical protein KUCAC02_017100 [Chaenocephalus aceratus]
MHAPKRGSSPDDSQCKIRKLDQDEDDMQSTTAPATNNTAADSRNKPAKSSIQSSPPKDSSKTISEPPLKESKLLNATSASCGEAPSQKANSNASLKRTASTESEDELSSDSSKTDPFRERHDGDKARCIRKYSNRVKAKRKAEEPTSDPQETGQGSPSAPEGPVQMDHNYGRFSDSSMGELDMDERKESAHSVTELQVQVMSVNATQAESKYTLVAASRSAKASIEFECPDDQIKHEELKNVEGQKLNDNKTPTSCIESLDSVTATAEGSPCITSEAEGNEKKDINNQKCVDNETVAPAVVVYSTGEANPGCEVEIQLEESMNSFPTSPTVNITETKDTTESVSKETLDVKCKSEDEGQEANVSADHIDVANKALSNETNVEGGVNPESQTNKKLTLPTGNPDTQTDLSVKIQVTFKEESNIIHQVSHEVPDAITNSCEDVDKLVRKSEEKHKESDRKGVEFLSTQTVAVSASFAEVQVMEKTTDSCTEILTSNCEAVPEQNPNKVLSECVTDLKGHIDTDLETNMTEDRNKSAPKEDTLNGGNHMGNDNTTQIPAVVEEVAETRIEKENNFEDISNEATTMEIQIQKRQEVSEHTADISTEFNQDCVSNSKIMENDDNQDFERTSGPERQTTSPSLNLNPASSVEVQIQERPRDDEPIADMSDKTQKHPFANCQKAEGRVDAEAVVAAENLNRVEVDMQTTTASEETSNIAPTVDMQTTTTTTTTASEETSNIAPTVDVQTTTTASEETSNIAPTPTVDMQTTTTASEETSNIAPTPTVDMQTTTTASEETSNIAPTPTVDMQTTTTTASEETSNNAPTPTVDIQTTTTASEETSNIAPTPTVDMQTTTTASEETSNIAPTVDMQTTTTTASEETSNIAPTVDMQTTTTTASEETSNIAPTPTVDMQTTTTTASEETSNIAPTPTVDMQTTTTTASEETSNIAPTPTVDMQTTTTTTAPEETSNIAPTVDVQTTTTASEETSNIAPTVDMQTTTTTASEETSNIAPTLDMQTTTTTASEETSNIAPTVDMQTTTTASEETSNIAPTVDMQSQEVIEPTTDMSAELHEDQKAEHMEHPAPVVESIIEVDMQTTSSEEIIDKAHALEIQSQNEVNIKTAATSMEISNMAETQAQVCQAAFEPETDSSQKGLQTPERNGNENKVTAVCVSATGNQRQIDLQSTTTREETSDPTTKAETQNRRSQKVEELTTQVSDPKDFIVANTTSEENKDTVITVCVDATDNHIEMDVRPTAAPDISNQPLTDEMQSNGSPELHSEAQNDLVTASCESKEKENGVNAESVDVTDVQINMETTKTPEDICDAAPTMEEQNQRTGEVDEPTIALSSETNQPPPWPESEDNANMQIQTSDNIQGNMDVVGLSTERVSDIEGEGTGSNEVIVFVCRQPDDADIVIPASDEPMNTVNQADVEIHENQMVYEPISSPESNDDREISTASENRDGASLLDIQNTREMEGDVSTSRDNSCSQQLENEEDLQDQMCVPDSRDVE